jgi:hypothetical protein
MTPFDGITTRRVTNQETRQGALSDEPHLGTSETQAGKRLPPAEVKSPHGERAGNEYKEDPDDSDSSSDGFLRVDNKGNIEPA